MPSRSGPHVTSQISEYPAPADDTVCCAAFEFLAPACILTMFSGHATDMSRQKAQREQVQAAPGILYAPDAVQRADQTHRRYPSAFAASWNP